MEKQSLKEILIDKDIFVRETNQGKNLQCRCPMCGDHKDKKKAHHLYVATDKNVCHCFLCGYSTTTTGFIKKLTGMNVDPLDFFSREQLRKEEKRREGIVVKTSKGPKRYEIPDINFESFPNKREYLKKRTNFNMNVENIPNLILDMFTFFRVNNIPLPQDIFPEYFQKMFVGFLCHNHRYLICRNTDPTTHLKFKKIILQDDPLEMIDYYCIEGGNPKSNKIVMSEGIFNILGSYSEDVLNLRSDVKLYIACNSFIYTSVLKAVCFDHHIFQPDVTILSDQDKKLKDYKKFYNKSEHMLSGLGVYYNRTGNDFGIFPLVPFKGGNLRDVSSIAKNRKSF